MLSPSRCVLNAEHSNLLNLFIYFKTKKSKWRKLLSQTLWFHLHALAVSVKFRLDSLKISNPLPFLLQHFLVSNQAESVCNLLLSWVITFIFLYKMATLRRSSAKLKGLGTGHGDLILAISQWKELKSATKSLLAAQEATSNDLLKWSSKEVSNHLVLTISLVYK